MDSRRCSKPLQTSHLFKSVSHGILPILVWEEKFYHHRRTDHDTFALAGDCGPPRAVDGDSTRASEKATEQLWRDRDPMEQKKPSEGLWLLPQEAGVIRLAGVLGEYKQLGEVAQALSCSSILT